MKMCIHRSTGAFRLYSAILTTKNELSEEIRAHEINVYQLTDLQNVVAIKSQDVGPLLQVAPF